jgi:hypothetical protein
MAEAGDSVKLKKFNPNDDEGCAAEWEDYKRLFLIHLDAQGLDEASGRRKVGQLLQHMGLKHVNTYDSFSWAPAVPGITADVDRGIQAREAVRVWTPQGWQLQILQPPYCTMTICSY